MLRILKHLDLTDKKKLFLNVAFCEISSFFFKLCQVA